MKKVKEVIQKANGRVALGETTPIQISLVIAILAFVVASVWWAATMNAKLDVVVGKIGAIENNHVAMRGDVDSLKLWKAEIDRSGSRALDDLRKEFIDFKTQFEIHAAREKSK